MIGNNSGEKEFYTLVLEISGINFSKSMSYCYNDSTFYLYPGSYLSNIEFIKKELAFINSEEFTGKSVTMEERLQFETGANTFSNIITNMKLDLTQTRIEIYNEIYAYFEILLKIFALIFEQFINITKIFIFKKEPCKYSLKRVICRKIDSLYREKRSLKFLIQGFEAQIPELLTKFYNSPENYEIKKIVNEFIHAKKTSQIELKAIYLWNFLEHLVNIYSKLKKRNLLIDTEKYKELKQEIMSEIEEIIHSNQSVAPLINSQLLVDEIGRVINSLDFTNEINQPFSKKIIRSFKKTIREKIASLLMETNILVEGYNKQNIAEILINLINNFPGIIPLIKLMCKDLNYKLNLYEENLIFYMNKVRNFYFHKTIDNIELFELLKKEIEKKEKRHISSFNYQDFFKMIENFDSFIEKLLFHMLSFPQNLKEKKYSQSIRYFAYNKLSHPKEDNVSYFRNMFEQMYDDYTKEKKYHFLLRFLGRTIDNYKETLKKTHFSGIHFSEASDEDIKPNSLRFNNLYSGVLEDISEIKISQMAYEINVYMKYKEYNIDCLLFFRAVTDIDFRLHRLSFETDLLDFQIEAEYIAKKDMKKYSDLKNAISPLPLNFLEDDYYHQYFKWPNEYKKKLDEKPEDMEILIPIVIITPKNLKEFKRFTKILNIKNIQYRLANDKLSLSFSRYHGTGNIEDDRYSAWSDETVQYDLKKEFLAHFPFYLQRGFVFITNSPRLSAIFSLLFSKLSTMSWDFIGSFALIHYYIILLYEIEAERDLSIEYIYRIKEQREDLSKIEINIKNPEYINIVFQFRQRFLDLLLKILEYPKLKNIYKMNTISDEIREKSILPYLKREYKGTAWLSFGLNLALYLVISDDRDILETINNNWTNDLVSILEEISGKNASQEFFEDLFDLFDRYIESYFTQEKNEF